MSKVQWRDGTLADSLDTPVKFYEVEKNAFFRSLIGDSAIIDAQRRAMSDLLERYAICDRRVLSVGPGDGQQEYWFSERNKLLLVDIDENGSIERRLRELPRPASADDGITYAIGDARRIGDYIDRPFDVLLNFSFTPDEFHRTDTQANTPRVFAWPVGAPPFSDVVIEIARHLPPGGLFISLSYCGGPDATSPPYLPAMVCQLETERLELLDAYVLPGYPGVHMVVAQKKPADAPPPRKLAITAMHARAASQEPPVQIYSCDGDLGALYAPAGAEMAADIVRALHPTANSALSCGQSAESLNALLSLGLDLTIKAEAESRKPVRAAANRGTVSFFNQSPAGRDFDIIWLDKNDDGFRAAASRILSAGGDVPKHLVFSDESHRLMQLLAPEGTLIVTGRAGTALDTGRDFTSKIAEEFAEHGIRLHALYILKIATGIFLAVGQNGAPRSTAPVSRFWEGAQDSSAVAVDIAALAPADHPAEPTLLRFVRRLLP